MNAGSPPTWLTDELNQLIENCSRQSPHAKERWQLALQKALGRFQGANIESHWFVSELCQMRDPDFLLWFSKEVAGLKRHRLVPEDFWVELNSAIKQSPYPTKDWVKSFELVWEWLKKESKQASVAVCFKYLCCCEEAARMNPLPVDLVAQTEEYLSLQGMTEAK